MKFDDGAEIMEMRCNVEFDDGTEKMKMRDVKMRSDVKFDDKMPRS